MNVSVCLGRATIRFMYVRMRHQAAGFGEMNCAGFASTNEAKDVKSPTLIASIPKLRACYSIKKLKPIISAFSFIHEMHAPTTSNQNKYYHSTTFPPTPDQSYPPTPSAGPGLQAHAIPTSPPLALAPVS